MKKQQKAFTLAETLITLAILGVVAAITVPMLINKQMEAANRTKVKKAMATYEKALNQMIIENDIKGDVAQLNDATCSKTKVYFKAVETQGDCRFKTSDRVWWDITNIENPIIMLKDEYKTTDLNTETTGLKALAQSSENKEVFGMVGRFADGVLRINDNGFESTNGSDAQKAEVAKLYGFINNEKGSAEPQIANYGPPVIGEAKFTECGIDENYGYYKCKKSVTITAPSGQQGEYWLYCIGPDEEYVKNCYTQEDGSEHYANISNVVINEKGEWESYVCDSNFCDTVEDYRVIDNNLTRQCNVTNGGNVRYDCKFNGSATIDNTAIGQITVQCSNSSNCEVTNYTQIPNITISSISFNTNLRESYNDEINNGKIRMNATTVNTNTSNNVFIDCNGPESENCLVLDNDVIHDNCDLIQRKCEDNYSF